MHTQQHTWSKAGRAAWYGVVLPLLANLFLGLASWSVNSLHAEEVCTSYNFVQPPGSPFNVGEAPSSVAVSDFNRDSIPDLATANYENGTVTILLGNGTGGFTEAVGSPVSAGPAPTSVAVGDFNRDGNPDLVTANSQRPRDIFHTVTILLGDGTGSFTEAASSPVYAGLAPNSVAVGDFNRDGAPDLATANVYSRTVTILLGDGTGGFTEAAGSPVSVGNGPLSVAVGDFNRDGNPDLATANSSDDTVTILLGDGMGGFTGDFNLSKASPILFSVGAQPISMAVSDFNRDGAPDLTTANLTDNTVTILLGNGMGGFTQAADSPISVGIQPSEVVVDDFNRDDAPDLATANTSDDTVTILLGNGMGGFTQAADSPISVGAELLSVAVGDFNPDGRPDLATTHYGGSVTILLNTCTSPQYFFTGFLQPVDNPPVLNQVKAGQSIPVKFSLGGDYGLNILAAGSPTSQPMTCDSGAVVDEIETVTTSNSGLQYDATTDTYTYAWRTQKAWAGQCRQFTLTLTDGTSHLANFQFK